MEVKDAGDRIGSLSVGVGIATLSAFFACLAFGLLTLLMDPALTGADYWAEVGERARSDPWLTGILALSGIGGIFGVALTVRAIASKSEGMQ